MALAQSTSRMDWSKLELVVFGGAAREARGLVGLPGESSLHSLVLGRRGNSFSLLKDPLAGKVKWTVRRAG